MSPSTPTHMQFIGGTIYCSVKGGRLNLGADHQYGRSFVCPHCGTRVIGRLHGFVVSPNPYVSALKCAECGVLRHKHPAVVDANARVDDKSA